MITFSQTGGTSGITTISVSATSTQNTADTVSNYTLSNENGFEMSMPVVQRAFIPVAKYITITPSVLSSPFSGGYKTITINSNDDWSIDGDGWITISITGGTSGSTIVPVMIEENTGTSRNGIIKCACVSDHSISANTIVNQEGSFKPYINLGYYVLSAASESATTSVTVTSNISWFTMTDSRWITVNTLSGSNDGSVSFTIAENTSAINREGTITLFNTEYDIYVDLVIIQSASEQKPYIILSPESFTVSNDGSSGNVISVSANCVYDIDADIPWITVNAVSGSGNGSVSFSTSASSETGSSVGNIVFSNSAISTYASVERTFIPYLSADTTAISSSSSGGDFEIYVYSNINWSVSVDTDEGELSTLWLSVIPSSGSNNGSITISVGSGTTSVSGSVVLSSTKYGLSWVVDVNRREQVDGTKVFYTSTNGQVVNPYMTTWGPPDTSEPSRHIVSNTYNDGQGIIVFDGDVLQVPIGAFSGCGKLETIKLPDTVHKINHNAFHNCTGFTGGDVFHYKSSFTDRDDVVVGGSSFLNCGITTLVIDDDVTEIPNGVFADNYSLTSLTIGNSVITIGDSAFEDCRNLVSDIVIPNSVEEIGDDAFQYCSASTSVTIGSSCNTIGIYAFHFCFGMKKLVLGSSVSNIKQNAFDTTYNLEEIISYNTTQPTLGSNVFKYAGRDVAGTKIFHYPIGSDYSTFISQLPSGWTAVADITPTGDYLTVSPSSFTVDATGSTGNQISILSNLSYSISSNVNWITLSDISGTGNKTISFSTNSTTSTSQTNGTITISDDTLTKTVSVTRQAYIPPQPQIPNNEIHYTTTGGTVLAPYTTNGWGSTILDNTYNDGQGILEFGGNVTAFPYNAYSNKKELQTIEMPNSVTVISGQSFIYCSKLQEVTIGSGVTSILNYAFYSCSSLATIYAHPTTAPTLGTGVFGVASSGTLHYPSGSDYSTWISALPNGWTAVGDL